MEFSIDIKGVGAVKRMLDDVGKKQIPFATSLAINKVAFISRKNIQGKMKEVFDRPTRFTLNSVLYEKSTKKKLYAIIYLADIDTKHHGKTADYMKVQTAGGKRKHKGIEGHLADQLPDASFEKRWIVPARGQKLDRYGNLPRGEWNRIITGLGLSRETGYSANITPASKKRNRRRAMYFQTPYGIMKRTGKRTVKPVLYFLTTKPMYKQRLPFHEVVLVTHKRHFNKEFNIAFKYAMQTAHR